WHELQSGFSRWIAKVSRSEKVRSFLPLTASSRGGMSGGGGAGGDPRRLSSTNFPRLTGDVRVGFEVTARTEPSVRMPPRGLSGGNFTRRISSPITFRLVSP